MCRTGPPEGWLDWKGVVATMGLFVCVQAFWDGRTGELVQSGDVAREGHSVLSGREKMFRPLTVKFDVPRVFVKPAGETPETSTAVHSKRGPGRPRKNQ